MPPLVTFDALLARVQALPTGSLVAIEGFMASGKSRVADSLAAATSVAVVHLDHFVQSGDASLAYADRLHLTNISTELARNTGKTVLIEGICLREVLPRIGASADLIVYVKRISAAGLWNDGIDLEEFEQGALSVPGEPYTSDMRYHSSFRPHERAAVELHRLEQ